MKCNLYNIAQYMQYTQYVQYVNMSLKKKVTLTDSQKYELCLYANNNKRIRSQYVNWIEQKWGLRVDKSTITQILQTKDKKLTTEIIKPDTKRHKDVIVPELELALKEFVLTYQHRTILSDALLIEKAKLLADELQVPQGTLQVCQILLNYLILFNFVNFICLIYFK